MNEQVRAANLSDRDTNFHTAEYQLLYTEVGQNFRLAYNIAVVTMMANGAIIAWVSQSAKDVFSPPLLLIASLMPVLLTLFAFALYRFLLWRSATIYQYLHTIEAHTANNGLGWEHFYRQRSAQGKNGPASRLIFYALFLLQFGMGCAFAFVVFQKFL